MGKIRKEAVTVTITPLKPSPVLENGNKEISKTKEKESEYNEKEQTILELRDAVTEINEENVRLKDAIATNQLPVDEIVTNKRHFGTEDADEFWNTRIVATCEARQCADKD